MRNSSRLQGAQGNFWDAGGGAFWSGCCLYNEIQYATNFRLIYICDKIKYTVILNMFKITFWNNSETTNGQYHLKWENNFSLYISWIVTVLSLKLSLLYDHYNTQS